MFVYYAGWLNAQAGRLADRSGRRDKMLKSGTVPPKTGRMVSLFVWRCHQTMPIQKTGWFCSTYFMQPVTHSNAEMERVFLQINVKLKLRNRMSAELVNAILNIRTELKGDSIIKHFMIMTEIPEAVTM